MKFIHCADLHLDSKMETLPADKSKIRREEVLHTFERLTEYAGKNGVSAVIIAGDMFDTAKVTAKTRGRVLAAIKSTPEVDYLYLSGNHDDENFILSAGEEGVLPSNLKTFTEEWSKFSYGDTVISGIVLNGKNSKYVYDRLNLSPDNVNIVVMHGMAAGYKNSEAAEIISIPMFKGKNVDYLALGHIHSYAEGSIDERGTYAYSGCAEGRGFDETGEKGFVLINVENGRLTREFVEFSRRSLFEYTFDVSDFGDWYEARNALLNELSAQFSPESLIKVILSGVHTPDFDIDREDLTARLNERFFFAKVYDRTGLKVSIEDYETDKSVRGEFVRAVLLSDLSKEEKDAVIMTGLNALKGEGI